MGQSFSPTCGLYAKRAFGDKICTGFAWGTLMKKIKLIAALLLMFTFNVCVASNLQTLEQELIDSVITTKITTRYTKNTQINPFKLFVSTENGVVTLRGHVKDKEAFITALLIAKNTKGVTSINADELEIKQVNTAFTDAYITAKVETAILKAKILDDESIPLVGISATTSNGIVTLCGSLKHSESIPPLLKRTLAIRGVKRVVSRLQVESTAVE